MANTITTKEWDALATATLDEHKTKLRDATFKDISFLEFMESGGRVERINGGELISYPLMYGRNSTVMRLSNDYQKLDTSPQEGFTRAFYEWRQMSVAITISRAERNKNSGDRKKLLDLLKMKTKQARMSIRDAFHSDLMGEGGNGGQAGGNYGIDGLQFLLEDTGTVGLIPESTVNDDGEQWWKPQRITSGVTATNLKEQMEQMLNDLRTVGSEPTIIVGAQAVHQEYSSQLTAIADWRLQSGGQKKIGFGFKGSELEFAGIPFVWDRRMPANTIYFLNTDSLGLVFHPDGEFNLGPMVTPSDQHASVAHIYVMAQLVCANRRDQGVISGINLAA